MKPKKKKIERLGNRADVCYDYFLEQLKQQGGFNEESGFTTEGVYKGQNSRNAHLLKLHHQWKNHKRMEACS